MTTRKLSAEWSLEERELVDIKMLVADELSKEITAEIDKEILFKLRTEVPFINLQEICQMIYNAKDQFESRRLKDFAYAIMDHDLDAILHHETPLEYIKSLTTCYHSLIAQLSPQDKFTYELLGIKYETPDMDERS